MMIVGIISYMLGFSFLVFWFFQSPPGPNEMSQITMNAPVNSSVAKPIISSRFTEEFPVATAIPTASAPSRWRQTPLSEASASQRASAPCYGLTEDILVVPVVVAPFELGNVERQILRADVVEGPDNAALQERPDAVDRAGVDLAANVFAPAMSDDS